MTLLGYEMSVHVHRVRLNYIYDHLLRVYVPQAQAKHQGPKSNRRETCRLFDVFCDDFYVSIFSHRVGEFFSDVYVFCDVLSSCVVYANLCLFALIFFLNVL